MKDRLKAALLVRHPDMKALIADRCVNSYVDAVVLEVANQFALMSKDDWSAGELNFGAEAVMHACKQVVLNGKRVRVWSLMQGHRSTSLVLTVYRGNNLSGRVSRVVFNPAFRRDIMQALQALAIELNPSHLQELDIKSNMQVPVDPASIRSFILQTRRTIAGHNLGQAYEDKLTRSLTIANTLQARIKSRSDGSNYVDEYWEAIDSGRVYGHGLSLQRVPKEVRHAMLGECHRYDFKASSYALLTSLAVQIEPTLQVGAIKDYIKSRSVIRSRVATAVGISTEWAKRIFTALGFGAELKDSPHNAIRGLLGRDKYNLLVTNDEFSGIAKQLRAVSKVINAAFPSDGFEFYGREYSPIDPRSGSKRTKNQKLAWIYQCLESEALDRFIELAGAEPLLAAHDCLYFRNKLPARSVEDIAYLLSQDFEFLRFEHERITPIHAAEDHGRRDRQIDAKARAHADLIAIYEREAVEYQSPHLCDISVAKKLVVTPWGAVETDAWEQLPKQRASPSTLART